MTPTLAEEAVNALYCLHPKPHEVMEAVLKEAASRAGQVEKGAVAASQSASSVPASRLSRFLFLVGHCALSHLAHVDGMAKRIRRERLVGGVEAAEGKAAAAGQKQEGGGGKAGGAGEGEGDIASQIGMGAQAAVSFYSYLHSPRRWRGPWFIFSNFKFDLYI